MFWAQVRGWGVVGAKAREQEPHAYVIVSVPQGECCGFVGSITLERSAGQVGCRCCTWAVAGGGITAPVMILAGTAHHGNTPGSCNVPAPAC